MIRHMYKTVLMFPGQGSQNAGKMISPKLINSHIPNIYNAVKSVRNVYVDKDIFQLILKGPQKELSKIENIQPSVFISSYLTFLKWTHSHNINLNANKNNLISVGFSLGEITALTAARAFSFETGLELVKLRAECMSKSYEFCPSSMVIISGIDSNVLQGYINDFTLMKNKQTFLESNKKKVLTSTNIEINKSTDIANANLSETGNIEENDTTNLTDLENNDVNKAAYSDDIVVNKSISTENTDRKPIEISIYLAHKSNAISGSEESIMEFNRYLKKLNNSKIIVVKLALKGGFHSYYMKSHCDPLSNFISNMEINMPLFPVFSNVTGMQFKSTQEIRNGLITHLTRPVLWSDIMQNIFYVKRNRSIQVNPDIHKCIEFSSGSPQIYPLLTIFYSNIIKNVHVI